MSLRKTWLFAMTYGASGNGKSAFDSLAPNKVRKPSPLEQMGADFTALGLFMEVLALCPLLDLGALGGQNAAFWWDATFIHRIFFDAKGNQDGYVYTEFNLGRPTASSMQQPADRNAGVFSELLLLAFAWAEAVEAERLSLAQPVTWDGSP